ncbi:sensitivity to high expression protein she9 [Coemansia erecta]|uniref:Sensitive to high expression protein 9, mitochondrial n=1 Tax=Coemansia erecta TaxID=147472 RepID=A0A9W8CQI3_9FUNG|nr:sensitivity to high expression protein she9 [Coemansia erecta]
MWRTVLAAQPQTAAAARMLRCACTAYSTSSVSASTLAPPPAPGRPERDGEGAEIAANNHERALVPLTVIYLPPPPWHQPLQPIGQRRQGPSRDASPAGKRANGSSTAADAGSGAAAGPSREPAGLPRAASAAASAVLSAVRRWQPRIGTTQQAQAVAAAWAAQAAQHLNGITGFDAIERLKAAVDARTADFHRARQELQAAKEAQAAGQRQRLAGQRSINELLQRKARWDAGDVQRLTALYEAERLADGRAARDDAQVRQADGSVDRAYERLVGGIRERYHGEQVWSDKIRRASTYATWAVLAANALALLLAQAFFEPRKRRRIVGDVDERLEAVAARLGEQVDTLAARVDAAVAAVEERGARLEERGARLEEAVRLAGAVPREQPLAADAAKPGAAAAEAALLRALADSRRDAYGDAELDTYYGQAEPPQPGQKPEPASGRRNGRVAAGVAAATALAAALLSLYYTSGL